jgi:RimJ/RimL family protein N-acetyltransferase
MRVNMAQTYLNIFCNTNNLVLDIGGDGIMAFERASNGICAWLYGASWGPASMRAVEARTTAYRTALLGLGVHAIEGVTAQSNTLAKKAMRSSGMKYKGRLPGALWYNGERTEGAWFEITREDLELPPV